MLGTYCTFGLVTCLMLALGITLLPLFERERATQADPEDDEDWPPPPPPSGRVSDARRRHPTASARRGPEWSRNGHGPRPQLRRTD